MRLIGQQKRVYDILKARPLIGVTSQQLRDLTDIVDIPKVISTLRDKGYQITDKPEKLGDSMIKRYFLSGQTGKPIRWEFDNKTNTARPIY